MRNKNENNLSILEEPIALSNESLNIDDVYLEGMSAESTSSIPEKQLGLHIRHARWNYIVSLILLLLCGIIGKAWWLQITHGSEYLILAEENRVQLLPIVPTRGKIYDRNGVVLADNTPLYQLTLQKKVWEKFSNEEKSMIERRLAAANVLLDDTAIKNSVAEEIVIRELSYEEALSLITMTRTIRGIDVKITSRRDYRDPLIYAHILGYVSSLSEDEYNERKNEYLINGVIGKVGIEKQYEEALRGELGKKSIEVNALGKEISLVSLQEPVHGKDITLTIDSQIQEQLYAFVNKQISYLQKGRGAAIVINPNNGEILAMVSFPGYNNQTFYQGIDTTSYSELLNNENNPLFNRAVDGQYPPGSTFKLIVAAAGLEEKLITPQTTVYSTGGIQVSRWFFPDWKTGGHGITNLYKAISESVNTYFYILGGGYNERVGLGVSRINEQARKFGLGSQTGVDFPQESNGLLPTPNWKLENKKERWYIGDTYNLSIGQGDLLVTPLQMANVITTIGNGGTLYRPHFYKEGGDKDGNQEGEEWLIDTQVSSKKNIEFLRRALRETVLTGSGLRLRRAPITSAGKTGTAEWSNTKDPHGWYIGFAPYENPEIAFAIIVEEGIGGNTAAIPIADDFLNWYGSVYTLGR